MNNSIVSSIIDRLIAASKLCQKCGCTFKTPTEREYFAAKTEDGFCCPSCR